MAEWRRAGAMNLPREFYAVIAVAAVIAFLLLTKAFNLREEKPAPPGREEQLRAAREDALRQIEILRNPARSRDTTGWGREQIARLQAVVAEIDAELKN